MRGKALKYPTWTQAGGITPAHAGKRFVDTITRAKARVEQYAEERLFDRDGSNGAQFSLRNNFKGWDVDKRNDDSGEGKITIVNNIPRPEKQDGK